jgi:hypothetical protein
MNKFEQLIEYVINDDQDKARELFHDIVVEKSRSIWEDLEQVEEADQATADEDLDEDAMGGDASDDLIDDIEMEEEGLAMEDDEEVDVEMSDSDDDSADSDSGDSDSDDSDSDEDLEDRVMDLEDKLDELMAEFESMMDAPADAEDSLDVTDGDDFGAEEGGDAIEMDDTEEMLPTDGMMEAVTLSRAPAPKTSEESFVNTRSTVAADSGKTGMQGAPVKMTGDTAKGRPAPSTKDLPGAGQYRNVAGKGGNAKLDSAPKPVTTQAAGVNTKTPFPKG